MQKSEELRLLAFCVFWMKRLSGLSLRGSAGAVAISQHQPEHGKAFGESVSACYALSVTFGDSSPRGRAKVASLPAMTREGGACKFVTMPLRMGWVSPSCHCILPVAAGSQVCHCEPCGARRGNLAVLAGTRESLRRTRSIHKVIDSHSSMNYCSSALRAILGSPFGRAGGAAA